MSGWVSEWVSEWVCEWVSEGVSGRVMSHQLKSCEVKYLHIWNGFSQDLWNNKTSLLFRYKEDRETNTNKGVPRYSPCLSSSLIPLDPYVRISNMGWFSWNTNQLTVKYVHSNSSTHFCWLCPPTLWLFWRGLTWLCPPTLWLFWRGLIP